MKTFFKKIAWLFKFLQKQKIFSLKMAVFSLFFWTVFVAVLELTLFRALLDMSVDDMLHARKLGMSFNFVIGGFYHPIYDLFKRRWKLSVNVSKYGAIGSIKLGVNLFIYSYKSIFLAAPFIWHVVLLKASLVVLAGTLATKLYTQCYKFYLKYIWVFSRQYIRLKSLRKSDEFRAQFVKVKNH